MRAVGIAVSIAFAGAAVASAQGSSLDVQTAPLGCVPQQGRAVVQATIAPEVAGSTVRLYFRRMSLEVEDFYSVQMEALGAGKYWGVLPQVADKKLERRDLKASPAPQQPWAAWWKAKEASDHRDPNGDLNKSVIRERASLGKLEKRQWMTAMPDAELQPWLESLENEPVEYFVAVTDSSGRRVAASEMKVAPVMNDCRAPLTPQQKGFSENTTLGESAAWQKGEPPFHWECDGIVTRYDAQRIRRADEFCRSCVVK